MIGNDVVDLNLARIESNWQRKGFLDKIFTENEQQFIVNSKNPEIEVWKLWSRKEACYKIWNRKTKIRKFNPIQFECLDFVKKLGKVLFDTTLYYTKTKSTNQFVYSIAVSDIKYFDSISDNLDSNTIKKQNGIPYFINKNNEKKPVSKTHHGRFEFAINL